MITGGFELTILVLSATVLGLIAYHLKQPTLIAYLFAGIIVGPAALGLTESTPLTETAAELGLAFLLFLIGVELNFGEVKSVFRPVIKISAGVMASILLVTAFTGYLIGFSFFESFLLGLALMYSSTAIVEKYLSDENAVKKTYGELNTGNLLIQDIVVVMLMVLVVSSGGSGIAQSLVYSSIFLFLAIIGTIVASKVFLPRLVSYMASRNLPLFITGIAWLSLFLMAAKLSGMSIEVGAFIAGLGLGQLNFSEEIKYDIKPLTELFLAFFFLNFGLGLSGGEFLSLWPEALILSIILMVSKLGFTFVFTYNQGFSIETSLKSGLTMMQTSEFSLVFGATLLAAGLIGDQLLGLITLVAIITMTASSYIITVHGRLARLISKTDSEESDGSESSALILGYNNAVGKSIETLREKFDKITVIGTDSDVEIQGAEYLFGDVYHEDLRKEKGIQDADFVMVNIDDKDLHKLILDENEGGKIFLRSETEYDRARTYDENEIVSEAILKAYNNFRGEEN